MASTYRGLRVRRVQVLWLLWWFIRQTMLLQKCVSTSGFKKRSAYTTSWTSPSHSVNWPTLVVHDNDEIGDLFNIQWHNWWVNWLGPIDFSLALQCYLVHNSFIYIVSQTFSQHKVFNKIFSCQLFVKICPHLTLHLLRKFAFGEANRHFRFSVMRNNL